MNKGHIDKALISSLSSGHGRELIPPSATCCNRCRHLSLWNDSGKGRLVAFPLAIRVLAGEIGGFYAFEMACRPQCHVGPHWTARGFEMYICTKQADASCWWFPVSLGAPGRPFKWAQLCCGAVAARAGWGLGSHLQGRRSCLRPARDCLWMLFLRSHLYLPCPCALGPQVCAEATWGWASSELYGRSWGRGPLSQPGLAA